MMRKLTKAAIAGITAHETSCPLEHAYGPGLSALLGQENGDSGLSHMGKTREETLAYVSLLLNTNPAVIKCEVTRC